MNKPNQSSDFLDLSSLPLLRIDQVHLHHVDTLLQSEAALIALISKKKHHETAGDNEPCSNQDDTSSFVGYVRKLAQHIRSELAHRRIQSLLEDGEITDHSGNESEKPCNDNVDDDDDDGDDGDDTERTSPQRHFFTSSLTQSSMTTSTSSTIAQTRRGDNGQHNYSRRKSKTTAVNTNTHTKKVHRKQQHQEERTSFKLTKKQGQSSPFVVIPSNSKQQNQSFRQRAKVTKAVIKAKALQSSDGYQMKVMKEEKQRRRQMAIDRISSRKAKKVQALRELERRKTRRQAREERRRKKEAEVMKEMGLVAAEAKRKIIESGEVEIKGNEAAAIAAAQVLEDAATDLHESDSASSIGSHIDEVSECTNSYDEGRSSTFVCQKTMDFGNESIQEENEEKQSMEVDTDDIRHESTWFMRNFGIKESIDKVKVDTKAEDSAAIMEKGKFAQKLSNDKEEVIEDINNLSDSQHSVNKIKVMRSISQTSVWDQDKPSETLPIALDDVQMNNINEVDWHPWSPTVPKDPIGENNIFSDVNKHLFTQTYPFFYSIFTTFQDQRKGTLVRTDAVRCRERSCIEYQIKAHSAFMDVYDDKTIHDPNDNNEHPEDRSTYYYRVSSWKQEVNSIVSDVLLSTDIEGERWVETKDEDRVGNCWNLLWTWKKPKFNPEHLLTCQKISRFKNTSSLTRKDRLKKKLHQYCTNKNYTDVMPTTFVLPGEYNRFVSAFYASSKLQNHNNLWIMKPVGMSRGRGISLINDIGGVSYSMPSVIQNYVSNPLLYHGFKFDLRLYVTVLSFMPKLEAFIYKEGFARFGSRPFSDKVDLISDQRIHLTNSSIQKDFAADLNPSHPARLAGSDGGGNKVKISWLWSKLDELGICSTKLWTRIRELSLKTLLAVCDDIPPQQNSFELFGFDVLIDASLNPWLIEVNACPSLARDTDLDCCVKDTLIEDTIKLVRPSKIDRNALKTICQRRLHQTKASPRKAHSSKDQLEQDLKKIFCNVLPRQYGDHTEKETFYERLVGHKSN